MCEKKRKTMDKQLNLFGENNSAEQQDNRITNQRSRFKKGTTVGFYKKILDQAEQLDFETVSGSEGLDDEITLLRVKIKAYMEKHPEDLCLLMEATDRLAKLVKTRYSISNKEKEGLKEAIGNVLQKYALPLGVALINKKL
jgi:hypothetical protein